MEEMSAPPERPGVLERAKTIFRDECEEILPTVWGRDERDRAILQIFEVLSEEGKATTYLQLVKPSREIRYRWLMELLGKSNV